MCSFATTNGVVNDKKADFISGIFETFTIGALGEIKPCERGNRN
jgi:hypothetical protein